jgi:oligopeptide/dipeptide ABC transporter ATP-binding protein
MSGSQAADTRSATFNRPLLEVSSLSVDVPCSGTIRRMVVSDLSFHLEQGELLAIVGESGSGKTLSGRALLGLLPAEALASGSVTLNGKELLGMPEPALRALRGSTISLVQQNSSRSLNPTMRVGDQIIEVIRAHGPVDHRTAKRRATSILESLGFRQAQQQMRAFPHELSGGMQQRVAMGIAIAGGPQLLIADEPTRSLDAISQRQTLTLLRHLQTEAHMAIILISHDLRTVAEIADNVLVMYAGRVVERVPASDIMLHSRMRYTRALLDALPQINGVKQASLKSVPMPLPNYTTDGCDFAPRCQYADSRCFKERPPAVSTTARHSHSCWHPFLS